MPKSTSSAPRPAPKAQPVKQPPKIQHQTTDHPQPSHTKKGGKTDWG